MDDQSIGPIITYAAGFGAVLGGAGVGGYLVWQVLRGLGLNRNGMSSIRGGLNQLRAEVSEDTDNQLRALEERLIKRLEELRTEFRTNLQEVKQDVRENRRDADARMSDLERGRRPR